MFIDRFHRILVDGVVSVEKKLRFQMKTDTCGRGLSFNVSAF